MKRWNEEQTVGTPRVISDSDIGERRAPPDRRYRMVFLIAIHDHEGRPVDDATFGAVRARVLERVRSTIRCDDLTAVSPSMATITVVGTADNPAACQSIARRIFEVARAPYAGHRRRDPGGELCASLGVAVAPVDGGDDPAAMIATAERALDRARQATGGSIVVLGAPTEAVVPLEPAPFERFTPVRQTGSLAMSSVVVHDDPRARVGSLADHLAAMRRTLVRSAERCIRWRHAIPELRVELELSLGALQPGLAGHIDTVAREAGLPTDALAVVIGEEAVAQDPPMARRRMHELADAGVPVVLGRFGSGHSALSLLSDLPIDAIVLDPSFMTATAGPRVHAARAILASTIRLGESLGLNTVVSGVASLHDVTLVQVLQPSHSCGPFWGAAMPEQQLEAMITAQPPPWLG